MKKNNVAAFALNTRKQFVKFGCDAGRYVEDRMDDVAHSIRRQPLKCTAMTFGVALGIGALAGWAGGRRR
jgi:hypothetical protein